jgi:hypothetical protein
MLRRTLVQALVSYHQSENLFSILCMVFESGRLIPPAELSAAGLLSFMIFTTLHATF